MKKVFLALFFVSISAFAEARTPALEQYMGQLECATAKAVERIEQGVEKKAAVAASAAICVPKKFVAEQRGLPTNVAAPARAERLVSLADSTMLRLDLCERAQVKTTACLKLFQKSE